MANKPVIRKAVQSPVRRPSNKPKTPSYLVAAEARDVSAARVEAAERRAPQSARNYRLIADNARAHGKPELGAENDRKAAAIENAVRGRSGTPTANQLLKEPFVYTREAGGKHSWLADMYRLRTASLSTIPMRNRDVEESVQRLAHYGLQIKANVEARSEVGTRVLQMQESRYASEGYEHWEAEHKTHTFLRHVLNTPYELRIYNTGATSLGALSAPQFLTADYAIWRTAASPLLALADHSPLSPYGMAAYLPTLQGAIGASVQAGDNASIVSAGNAGTFSAGYTSAGVQTLVAGVEISQQTIDRIGPDISFDELLLAQASREISTVLESTIAAVIIANAQAVTRNGSSFTTAEFWSDLSDAIQLVAGAAGVHITPTALFGAVSTLLLAMGAVDSEGRPIFSPNGAAKSGGSEGPRESYTGYTLLGCDLWGDDNLGGPSAGYSNLLVGDPHAALLVLSTPPVIDIYPSFEAQSLTAFAAVRTYAAWQDKYPTGWCTISGTAYTSAF
jgi:hypothetical protein